MKGIGPLIMSFLMTLNALTGVIACRQLLDSLCFGWWLQFRTSLTVAADGEQQDEGATKQPCTENSFHGTSFLIVEFE
jgi:hypothetical protein